jgi:hypothetical protein
MRITLRQAAVAAALAAVALGAPANAGCIGCGGAAAPGGAGLSLNAAGRYNGHAVTASCSYASTPSAGTYVGNLHTEASATSNYSATLSVAVSCSLQSSAGNYSANGYNTGSTPTQAHASGDTSAPALAQVYRLCLSVSAAWNTGSDNDAASAGQCIYPGLWGSIGDVVVEVPISPQQ